MKAVIVSPSLPLPFGKADSLWLHMILKELARRGHEVTCLSCTEEPTSRVSQAANEAETSGFRFNHVALTNTLKPLARKVASARRPFSELARVDQLAKLVDTESEKADVVHIEHLFSAWSFRRHPNAVTFLHHLESVDVEGITAADARERLTRVQMRRATRQLLRSSRPLLVATERIKQCCLEVNPQLDIVVVPVGIDPARYSIAAPVSDPVAGLIGLMSWPPSRNAAENLLVNLWPAIHSEVKDSRLLIAGRDSREQLNELFPVEGAELVGEVDDAQEFFSRLALLVYPPVRGTGMKIKVLEALAMGIPVISNSEGLEGLDFAGPAPTKCADRNEDFVAAAVDLLRDPQRRAQIAAEGTQFIQQFGPEPAVDRLMAGWHHFGINTD